MHVAVVGGGMAGLGTALACARDGHQVTVFERDDTPMPETPDAAFGWERRGAPQVRHSHAFLARMREALLERAPDVLEALLAAGATEMPFTENLPATLTDRDPRPGDDELVALACRRTTFEWVLRTIVTAEQRVEWRGGVVVDGLDGTAARVTGVGGMAADLIVDARGPRANSDEWLASLGARPGPEELHESGIVYFSRFYRLAPGRDIPPSGGPVAADLGYLKFAVFLGDNGTFSITYAVDSRDETLRRALGAPEGFEAAAGQIAPAVPYRADGMSEPITDVHVMAGLRNRHRAFVVDDEPILGGFVPVGDAAVCTNPLYGRGCSLAIVHAFGLADAMRIHGDDVAAVARAHHANTERDLVPWFKQSVIQDEQARMQAAGEEYAADDPRAFMQGVFREGLLPALRTSPVVFRAFLRWFNLLTTPDALMADPEIVAAVFAAYEDRANHVAPDPIGPATRAEFLAAIAQ